MSEPFSILDRLPDANSTCFGKPSDLRTLANELEMNGAYQILFGRRDGDHSDQIEIFVTYPKKT